MTEAPSTAVGAKLVPERVIKKSVRFTFVLSSRFVVAFAGHDPPAIATNL
jgi:hypothetical protein